MMALVWLSGVLAGAGAMALVWRWAEVRQARPRTLTIPTPAPKVAPVAAPARPAEDDQLTRIRQQVRADYPTLSDAQVERAAQEIHRAGMARMRRPQAQEP